MKPKYKVGDYVEFTYSYYADPCIGKITKCAIVAGDIKYALMESGNPWLYIQHEQTIVRKLSNEELAIYLLEN